MSDPCVTVDRVRVEIDIGLDFDGIHTFHWNPCEKPIGVEVAKPKLERWDSEREAFALAYRRWKQVIDEIDECMHQSELPPNPKRPNS